MITLKSTLRNTLIKDAEKQILLAHQKAAVPPNKEPDYVAHFCGRMPYLARQWKNSLKADGHNLNLTLSSVFTHSVPKVEMTTSGLKCELADLLIAIVDRRTKPAKGRAVLIQAKMNENTTLHLHGIEVNQLTLLHDRPHFKIISPCVPGAGFDVKFVQDSATQYGGAFMCFCGNHQCPSRPSSVLSDWLSGNAAPLASTSNQVALPNLMSSTLVELLEGVSGHEFAWDQTKDWDSFPDDWSKLINYLMDQAGNSVIMTRATKSSSRRRNGALHFIMGPSQHSFHLGRTTYVSRYMSEEMLSMLDDVPPDGGDEDDEGFVIAPGEGASGKARRTSSYLSSTRLRRCLKECVFPDN